MARMESIQKIWARIERRLRAVELTETAASREAGLSPGSVRNIRRGANGELKTSGVHARTLSRLAPVLKTTMDWLAEGHGPETTDGAERTAHTVPLVGYVGAGSAAHFVPSGQLGEVDRPEWANSTTVAVEIRGESLGPLFDQWIVYYDDVRRPVTSDLIGKLCVVGLADGRVLIKKLKRGKGKTFDLLSQAEEPIRNVVIEWAGRVKQMVPR
jgi:hypothetical protein